MKKGKLAGLFNEFENNQLPQKSLHAVNGGSTGDTKCTRNNASEVDDCDTSTTDTIVVNKPVAVIGAPPTPVVGVPAHP